MALYDYVGALKKGRKQYQSAVLKGEYPYLPVLDDILSYTDIVSEVSLGLMDIPLARIVGTKTKGRTSAFANNFMPLLSEKSEFGSKWAFLFDHQIEEGIHDPIVAYEFMNKFYVQEGNKRVSVLKYLGAFSIPGTVVRLIPRRSDEKENKLYYEFLDFYQVSFNCDVWFSREGSYHRLLTAMGKKPDEVWSEDDKEYFKAVYNRFVKVFDQEGGNALELTSSDAFLIYVEIFGYEAIIERTEAQIQKDLVKIWDEFLLVSRGGKIALVEQPEEVDGGAGKLMNWLRPFSNIEPEMLKIAFIYAKNQETSSWTYGHELGRMYLEQAYGGKLKTVAFYDADNDDETAKAIDLAIAARCNLIFTTSSQMINFSVKAAIQHPEVKIFNCSVNMSYSSISTYYCRMYESKFLMGALAASMAQSDKLGYIADYPIYGTIANINAFALGARMINPYVKVYLEWSRVKDAKVQETLEHDGITFISGEDMITPQAPSREYGLYHKEPDGTLENLATPIWHWGKFYEKIVELTCKGALDTRENKGKQAINFWWGMSADVIDVICSQNLPHGTNRLITFLKNSIRAGSFQPFNGLIYSQDGTVQCGEDESLSPEEIITMNWLADNVVGRIPEFDELTEAAQALVKLQGVKVEETTDTEENQCEDSGIGRS
ncbi:BMP family ABC transporter substrate-binding protein [Clostridium sp. MCC353]|uniref:BMP family ABC transporter substrate-binding protein n=1 Tax=Clostridium sp. MCC353 TaxID=2592646 RepID=UPI001C0123AA|nr:BMP family ABC transporter substrate-binding protein [Clostridium sp. MCC353]MBT9779223.1 BMP family ABC transporter substrate-binding protein [Clostridium sp. MCC353]